jgi:hypothetical protein
MNKIIFETKRQHIHISYYTGKIINMVSENTYYKIPYWITRGEI